MRLYFHQNLHLVQQPQTSLVVRPCEEKGPSQYTLHTYAPGRNREEPQKKRRISLYIRPFIIHMLQVVIKTNIIRQHIILCVQTHTRFIDIILFCRRCRRSIKQETKGPPVGETTGHCFSPAGHTSDLTTPNLPRLHLEQVHTCPLHCAIATGLHVFP